MPAGKHKSKRFKKIFVKVPGGATKIHRRETKPKIAKCQVTGEKLNAVPRLRPTKMKNLAKTKKRPERPYGGALSSKAMRAVFKKQAREMKS